MKLNSPIVKRTHGDFPLVHALGLDIGAVLPIRGVVAASQEGSLHSHQVLFTEPGVSGDDAGEVSATHLLVVPLSWPDLINLARRKTGDGNG